MKTLALMILAVLAPLPLASGPGEQEPEYVRPDYIYGDEAKQLVKALAASPQIPIGFENAGRSPLAIVGASISSVSRRQPGESSVTNTAESAYAVSQRITVVNKTDRHMYDRE